MKTYSELSPKQQKKAITYCLNDLLSHVSSGRIRFSDEKNEDDLQARIDAALAKAEKMHTPWYADEYLMEDEFVKESLIGMAECEAEENLYSEEESVIPLSEVELLEPVR